MEADRDFGGLVLDVGRELWWSLMVVLLLVRYCSRQEGHVNGPGVA